MSDWQDIVREHLLSVWVEQACQVRPADWPDVLARLLKDAPATPGGTSTGRGSLKPALDQAVAELAAIFVDQESLDAALDTLFGRSPKQSSPIDPGYVAWCAFPKLDRAHAARLADRLIAARQ